MDKTVKKKKKIIVAMSGGVDSSVTAYLLNNKGYEAIGLFIRLGIEQEKSEAAARAVCRQLNIRFYPLNLSQKFRKEIIDYFLKSYRQGLTPNPCVKCNQVIKFKELLRITKELKANFLATGHYARSKKLEVRSKKNIYRLYRGIDNKKDQTYFLYNLTQSQLAHILFPLGEYTKEQVKKIADQKKLPYLDKESHDICFLEKGGQAIDHNEFLKEHLKLKPGPIITLDGQKVGQHQGLPLYTIGQRKGVEIGGIGPFYVIRADYKSNRLYVARNGDDPSLFSHKFIVEKVNWVAGYEPNFPLSCKIMIRYRQKPVFGMVFKKSSKDYRVELNKPVRAITSGQSAVFYRVRRGPANAAHANENKEGRGTIPLLARSETARVNKNKEDEILGGGIIKRIEKL
jgi:tRNA-specific 2-thiouridylase